MATNNHITQASCSIEAIMASIEKRNTADGIVIDKHRRNSASLPRCPRKNPEVITEFIEKSIHLLYADWVDEPLPVLVVRTPRKAIQTPEGFATNPMARYVPLCRITHICDRTVIHSFCVYLTQSLKTPTGTPT